MIIASLLNVTIFVIYISVHKIKKMRICLSGILRVKVKFTTGFGSKFSTWKSRLRLSVKFMRIRRSKPSKKKIPIFIGEKRLLSPFVIPPTTCGKASPPCRRKENPVSWDTERQRCCLGKCKETLLPAIPVLKKAFPPVTSTGFCLKSASNCLFYVTERKLCSFHDVTWLTSVKIQTKPMKFKKPKPVP